MQNARAHAVPLIITWRVMKIFAHVKEGGSSSKWPFSYFCCSLYHTVACASGAIEHRHRRLETEQLGGNQRASQTELVSVQATSNTATARVLPA